MRIEQEALRLPPAFGILEDTLLGRWLPAYTRRPKRRVIGAPKFYFADIGVVNHLSRRGRLEPGGELFGKAFENWVFHELTAGGAYRGVDAPLAYWRLASGIEVDFIVGDMAVALEAKASARITDDHLRGLRALRDDHPRARRVLVSLEPKRRRTADGIEILPVGAFVKTCPSCCQRPLSGERTQAPTAATMRAAEMP